MNASADCISKLFGFDDNDFWGPHTIDRFACSYNAKLRRFNYSILSARLRDSLFSKLGLRQQQLALSSSLSYCKSHQALVLPLWKSAFFWNAFTRDGVLWNGFVVNWLYLSKFQGFFVPAWSAIPFSNPVPQTLTSQFYLCSQSLSMRIPSGLKSLDFLHVASCSWLFFAVVFCATFLSALFWEFPFPGS